MSRRSKPSPLDILKAQGAIEPELSFLTSTAVGFPVQLYWFDENGLTEYQVMRRDDAPGPGKEFWGWHLYEMPQFFPTPLAASAAFVESWLAWRERGGSDQ